MNSLVEPTGILVGDELGQIKKIDLLKKDCVTFNLTPDEALHPTKSVVSIAPLSCDLFNNNYLIANKANSLFIFDALSDELRKVRYHIDNSTPLVGAQCLDDQNVVIAYKNGAIHRINIEKDLCSARYKPNSKALNLLGIENVSPEGPKIENKSPNLNPSKTANEPMQDKRNINNMSTIFEPNWNVDTTYLTSFKVCKNRLATGGFNSDLKVFDITTGQNVFAAKSTNTDWLGLKHPIWISGVDWFVNEGQEPHLIATCSRTDPCVKIYDINERQKKPIISINVKNLNNANNESNLPSLTTLCTLPSLGSTATPSQSIVVGTTLGRMLAFDVRISTRATKVLGGFKGFSGGSIRDIKYIRDGRISCKLFSCSLDRFVRMHTLTNTSRTLEKKFYVKTKPTCLYPIVSNCVPISEPSPEEDDDDEFF